MADTLSQGDIDALLAGIGSPEPEPAAPAPAPIPSASPAAASAQPGGGPSPAIQQAVAAAAETATMDLSRPDAARKVTVKGVQVERRPGMSVAEKLPLPAVVFHGATSRGGFLMAIPMEMGAKISDIRMGGDGSKPPATLSDLYLSAVSEFSNLIAGSFFSATGGGSWSGSPDILVAESLSDLGNLAVAKIPSCTVVAATVSIENLMEGQWIMVMGEQQAQPAATAPPPAAAGSPLVSGEARPVQKVEFGTFEPAPAPEMPANMSLLMDVPMNITVELGRGKMTVNDVLNLGSGSIVELDKLAGEPVDFMVNGKLIAKGEVVVIDENFGIRVTDIVSPMERFRGNI